MQREFVYAGVFAAIAAMCFVAPLAFTRQPVEISATLTTPGPIEGLRGRSVDVDGGR